jgi:hypothetical protein
MLWFGASALESEMEDMVCETAAIFLNFDSTRKNDQELICQLTKFKVQYVGFSLGTSNKSL